MHASFVLLGLLVLQAACQNFTINVFNVDQADSQLILFPSGYSILVDLGELAYNSHKNADHVAERLEQLLGKKHIDTFVVTHYHMDHIGEYPYGGIGYLIEKKGFQIDKVVDRNAAKFVDYNNDGECDPDTEIKYIYAGTTSAAGTHFVCYFQGKNTTFTGERVVAEICSSSQIEPPDAGAEVTIVSTDAYGATMLNGKPVMGNYVGTKNPPSENDFSIGLRIRYKNFVYVTMGDLDGQYEDSFNAVYDDIETVVSPRIGEVDVYHADHHGSSHSSNENLISMLLPEVTLISCGEENRYSHPSQEVLDRLVKFGSDIYMTNNGTYTRNYRRTVVGGEIQITTDGDDTYDVSLLDKNQMTKTYKIKKVSSPECFP